MDNRVDTFSDLMSCAWERIDSISIEDLNFICSEGLMDDAPISLDEVHRQLDEAAFGALELTRSRTDLFEREREQFLNCEPIWRCYLLGAFLHRHLCISYCTEERDLSVDADWSRADRHFLFGLLSGNYHGTCASLPVLFVAVARRMGYPVYLVEFPSHCFVRWDERVSPYNDHLFQRSKADTVHFNIEFNGEGIDVRSDREIVERFNVDFPAMLRDFPNHCFMTSKSSVEELVEFLRLRAYAMESRGKYDEAMQAYEFAISLNPKDEVTIYEHREFLQLLREYTLGSAGVMAERGMMYHAQAMRLQQRHSSVRHTNEDYSPPSGYGAFAHVTTNDNPIAHGFNAQHHSGNHNGLTQHLQFNPLGVGSQRPGSIPTEAEWMFVPARYGLSRFRPMPLQIAERIFASVSSLRSYLQSLQPRKSVFRNQLQRKSSEPTSEVNAATRKSRQYQSE